MSRCSRVRSAALAALLLAVAGTSGASARTERADARPDAQTPEVVLTHAFRAALDDDVAAYLATIHPDKRETATERDAIERYEWSRFRKQASWYLTSEDPPTFDVVRRTGDEDERVRLFVQDQVHSDRMPVPVRFEKARGRWYIVANSL